MFTERQLRNDQRSIRMLYMYSFLMVILWMLQNISSDQFILCEGATSTLKCSNNNIIKILDAKFGRTDSLECPHSSIKTSLQYDCGIDVTTDVMKWCDSKQTCNPASSNAAYGGNNDPCPNKYKYLNVTYDCLSLATTAEMTTVAEMSEITSIYDTSAATSKSATSATEDLSCRCPCSSVGPNKWGFLRGSNLTMEQKRAILQSDIDFLLDDIMINKRNTTKFLRTKYSAPDDRVSAVSMGYVGVVVITLVAAVIVATDISRCFR